MAEHMKSPPGLRRWACSAAGTWLHGCGGGTTMRYRYTAPPRRRFAAMGLIGESGGGKTWTVERLISLWAQQKIRVIFADFKGSDPKLRVSGCSRPT